MRKLLLVGWDAADWKVIRPLLDKGEMPHLASIIRDGVHGNLSTISPPLSPMVWTSIATGKRPYKHGIHGFTEPADDGQSVRAISNLGRQCKAIWNILHQHGKRSIVVGWWPSHPAEPIHGVMVSDQFAASRHERPGTPPPPASVWPREAADRLADLRVHADDITGDMLRMFAPDAPAVDQQKDRSLSDLAGIVAECMNIHGVATELIETEPWDLAAVYFSGIDHFSHRFMQYHAGKRSHGVATAPEVYAPIVANAYRYHDVMLGRLIELAGPDAAVLVLSDHGFHSDDLLPDHIPAEAAGPAHDHREFGIFAFRGPGVRRGQRVYGASVLDITPTLLHYFGLPAAQDMDGKPLLNAFTDAAGPEPIASWEDVPGDDGRHPPFRRQDSVATAESLRQLVDLGYIAPPGEDARKNVERSIGESRYNLARAWFGGGHPHQAIPILQELLAGDREDARFYRQLFHCHLALGDRKAAAAVLRSYDEAVADFAPRARAELKKRLESGESQAEDRRENHERRALAEKASGYVNERILLRARLALFGATTTRRKEAARPLVEQLAKAGRRGSTLAFFLAEAFAAIGEPDRALAYLRRARRADPDHWRALALEARIHFLARRDQLAAARAIDSLALVYVQPLTHVTLGATLVRLGELARAEECFRIAIAQAPGLIEAHRRLAVLLRRAPARVGEAALVLARLETLRKKKREERKKQTPAASAPVPEAPMFQRVPAPPVDRESVVTIVSGLPRSGTSMMMQMLAAAGLPPYTDDHRPPDSDNPRGYFEHRQATALHRDASWIPEARGRVVKIVATLLPHLPPGEHYRIVLMRRNLEEVVQSQRAMLDRLNRQGARLDDESLRRAYSAQLIRLQQWLHSHPEIAVLTVDYAQALSNPAETGARLADFLGAPFDADRASAAIAPSLRRQSAHA